MSTVMTMNNTKVIRGCDISYWQGNVDFAKMYKAGIRFIIIRAGYGTKVDKYFVSYIAGALAAGICVGVYWFIYASNTQESEQNAYACIEAIAPYKEYITCGVWCDLEYDSDKKAGYMSNAKRSSLVKTFQQTLEKAGYQAGIYANQDYVKNKFDPALVRTYPLWFARYSSEMGIYAQKGKDGFPYIWQHTSSGKGSTYGVASKTIDLDRGYFDIRRKQAVNILDNVQTDTGTVKTSDNPYPKPARTVFYKKGRYLQRGDDVKWIQWHLWRCGVYLDGKGLPDSTQIDGLFGADSDTACKEVQRRLRMEQTGIVDAAMATILEKL